MSIGKISMGVELKGTVRNFSKETPNKQKVKSFEIKSKEDNHLKAISGLSPIDTFVSEIETEKTITTLNGKDIPDSVKKITPTPLDQTVLDKLPIYGMSGENELSSNDIRRYLGISNPQEKHILPNSSYSDDVKLKPGIIFAEDNGFNNEVIEDSTDHDVKRKSPSVNSKNSDNNSEITINDYVKRIAQAAISNLGGNNNE